MKNRARTLLAGVISVFALPGLALAAQANKDKMEKMAEKEPAGAFATLDKDGNGSISQEEYVAAQRERIGVELAKGRFAEFDKNRDGKISREEFGGTPVEPEKKQGPMRGKNKKAP